MANLEQRILDYLREHNTAYFWEIATRLSTEGNPLEPERSRVEPDACREALKSLIEAGQVEHVEGEQYRIKSL